jgi:phosphoribosylanthranilate isomerase
VIQVKICGITSTEDALVAAQYGAAALGFIFYPPSPRYIKPVDAKKIISAMPDKVVKVGVFVNEQPENIKKLMETCVLDMIQLHGDEAPEDCRQFPKSMIIKAVELKNNDDINRALSYPVSAFLLDTRHAGLYGGTGKVSNWELASRLKNKKPLILSGGLNAENVADALKTVAPDALDINSGVEASPGKKDHKKLARIFDIIRAYDTTPPNLHSLFQKRKI